MELKITRTKMKNSLESLNSRIQLHEKKKSTNLKTDSQTLSYLNKREKRIKKNGQNQREIQGTFNNINILGISEGEEKEWSKNIYM